MATQVDVSSNNLDIEMQVRQLEILLQQMTAGVLKFNGTLTTLKNYTETEPSNLNAKLKQNVTAIIDRSLGEVKQNMDMLTNLNSLMNKGAKQLKDNKAQLSAKVIEVTLKVTSLFDEFSKMKSELETCQLLIAGK